MKLLLDMNIPPAWVAPLAAAGIEARHWKDIGRHDADDRALMAWAREHGFAVFTHDLDFGALLHATGASAPSVIQLRGEDIRPSTCAAWVIPALAASASEIEQGVLMTLDPRRQRMRLLPLVR
jgi:predicted nuclease of predicted toxin-antitoxin system